MRQHHLGLVTAATTAPADDALAVLTADTPKRGGGVDPVVAVDEGITDLNQSGPIRGMSSTTIGFAPRAGCGGGGSPPQLYRSAWLARPDPGEVQLPTVSVNDVSAHFSVAGVGERVVFLHSGAGEASEWNRVTSEMLAGHRCAALDFYGCGRTPPWPGPAPMTVDDQAHLVAALIRILGAPAHLVGHSYGGGDRASSGCG